MATNKMEWITNLKGVAILAVVVGHMATPLSRLIYAWHIPLFFFLSGLLINTKRSIRESIIKDFNNLIIPFIGFGLLGLLAEYIKRWLWPEFAFVNGNINLKDEIIGIFWWMDYSHLHHYGFVLWFLPALFWAKNIYLVSIKSIKNKLMISAVATITGMLIAWSGVNLPFGLDKGLVGLIWLSMGWLLAGRYWLLSLIGLLLLDIPVINVAIKTFDYYGLIYSLIFINTLVGLFKRFESRLGFLKIFGDKSMEIFVLHPYINNAVYFLIIYYLKYNWIMEVAVVLALLSTVVIYYEKYKKN